MADLAKLPWSRSHKAGEPDLEWDEIKTSMSQNVLQIVYLHHYWDQIIYSKLLVYTLFLVIVLQFKKEKVTVFVCRTGSLSY